MIILSNQLTGIIMKALLHILTATLFISGALLAPICAVAIASELKESYIEIQKSEEGLLSKGSFALLKIAVKVKL